MVKREARKKTRRTSPGNESQEQLNKLIDESAVMFREEPRLVRGYKSKLRLRTEEPVYQRPYSIPMARQKAVADEVNRILRMGIIIRSRSPYSIPIIPVYKNSGEVRLCVDARKLNS